MTPMANSSNSEWVARYDCLGLLRLRNRPQPSWVLIIVPTGANAEVVPEYSKSRRRLLQRRAIAKAKNLPSNCQYHAQLVAARVVCNVRSTSH